jgi:acyl-CoA synthetase (NDP forming)
MFGLGGIFVETLQDVAFRVAPIDRETARAMIREIKGYTILTGVRGQKGADIDTLALIIERLSILAAENPEVTEIDLNPVRVHEKGITLLDARMIL